MDSDFHSLLISSDIRLGLEPEYPEESEYPEEPEDPDELEYPEELEYP
jgi:hypothetical protein